jgi:DNA-binding MarR family transcriptional regulator
MSKDTELLTEIRDLLLVLAEPALAKRDQRFRGVLRQVVGRSQKKIAAVFLMDGSRSQADISKAIQIDHGQLSRLVKSLARESLITSDEKHPKLILVVPRDFFEGGETDE